MTLIDQRILIPAPMQAVWQTIADHRALPKWRVDVTTVSVLTTEPSRVGTRRRIATKGGKRDIIEEMVVWYEGIGYEYRLIEGSDYRDYQARLRLQAAADGTIVQWIISYEYGGFLRRILSGRRRKKHLETLATDSLRQLRRLIESTGARLDDTYRVKNSMQAAPDAQSRAQYGAKLIAQEESSRQMAAIQASQSSVDETGPRIVEPPIRVEDTPSVPFVMPPSFLSEVLKTSETDIPVVLKTGEVHQDTRPSEPIEATVEAENRTVSAADTLPKRPEGLLAEPPVPHEATQPRPVEDVTQPPSPLSVSEPIFEETMVPRQSMDLQPIKTIDPDEIDDAGDDENFPPPTSKRDTGEISIWDAFGLRRPSDELSQIITELESSDDAASDTGAANSDVDEQTNTYPTPLDESSSVSIPTVVDDATKDITMADDESATVDASLRDTEDESKDGVGESHVDSVGESEPEPDSTVKAKLLAEDKSERKPTLEEWLAADEPPLPESSTDSLKAVVRIEQKPKIGLRRLQRQRDEAVRRRNAQARRDAEKKDNEI